MEYIPQEILNKTDGFCFLVDGCLFLHRLMVGRSQPIYRHPGMRPFAVFLWPGLEVPLLSLCLLVLGVTFYRRFWDTEVWGKKKKKKCHSKWKTKIKKSSLLFEMLEATIIHILILFQKLWPEVIGYKIEK